MARLRREITVETTDGCIHIFKNADTELFENCVVVHKASTPLPERSYFPISSVICFTQKDFIEEGET